MTKELSAAALVIATIFSLSTAQAQSPTVDYGVVTQVNQLELNEGGSTAATVAGALAGGAIGYGMARAAPAVKNGAAYSAARRWAD